jgi:uroporphyrin-III C-methyltransferase / precorrin-2 dehydrogenase / sirohydrochlorin ferrochelatase
VTAHASFGIAEMDFFPGFLDLRGKPCLVVGGGDVALRKARLLRAAGAELGIVAPSVSPAMRAFIESQASSLAEREFLPTDLDDRWLVVTATGRPAVDACVAAAAAARRLFCNSVDDLDNCSYITPAIVDRSPLLVAISSGGAAPVLARTVREKIELLLPTEFGRLAELAERWRLQVKARIGRIADRRHFWERLFAGEVPRLAMGGQFDRAERAVAELLVNSDSAPRAPGKAWLVGAGPGDPDLLTVRALRIMQTADVILHDRLVSAEVLALARRDADFVAVGKKPGCRLNSQAAINDKLVALVRAGKHVCRLKGGDPFVFGRGGEELQALREAGLAAEVVPGITAAAGCAASAGIPLTHRDASQSVVFVAAHGKDSVDSLDWRSLARDRQTLVFYMAVARFGDLMNQLIAHGRAPDTPVAIVERGTLPDQRVVRGRLGQLQLIKDARRIEPPAILIVGEVAAAGGRSAAATSPAPVARDAQDPLICAKQG